MSFILDALKKSESDRQRQSGPALFEVKVAPPRTRFPVWAIAIVALLVVNLSVVGWMLLRRPAHDEQQASGQPVAGQPVAGQAAAGQAAVGQPAPTPQASATPAPASQGPYQQPSSQQPSSQPPSREQPSGQPQAPYPAIAARIPASPTLSETPPPSPAAAPAPGPPGSEAPANPDDYAPAKEAASPLFKGHVKRGTEEGLPLYQDAATTPGANLPDLRLDLHVYAAKPQDRFALINMQRMHEGDTLSDGTRVESITPDGVILSRNGSKFLLPRD
jgi:hypothetical protein